MGAEKSETLTDAAVSGIEAAMRMDPWAGVRVSVGRGMRAQEVDGRQTMVATWCATVEAPTKTTTGRTGKPRRIVQLLNDAGPAEVLADAAALFGQVPWSRGEG